MAGLRCRQINVFRLSCHSARTPSPAGENLVLADRESARQGSSTTLAERGDIVMRRTLRLLAPNTYYGQWLRALLRE
jgi:hypothetical protein